jgi:hypothetical protein
LTGLNRSSSTKCMIFCSQSSSCHCIARQSAQAQSGGSNPGRHGAARVT